MKRIANAIDNWLFRQQVRIAVERMTRDQLIARLSETTSEARLELFRGPGFQRFLVGQLKQAGWSDEEVTELMRHLINIRRPEPPKESSR